MRERRMLGFSCTGGTSVILLIVRVALVALVTLVTLVALVTLSPW